ncbi:unnamed protein product [Bursaphelenchus okinawaensis]|uniref:Uncharacterized protein n=1 Tax=Bursaphelenchus okinawaensis TaxID=465554 RepID=A0A811K270_9BILA|nr:unnamed protein product [Bursaphelenchus okinawaensis]CAG9090343.1 unnamed protein product [Bursaphelenchus okinawaensis]
MPTPSRLGKFDVPKVSFNEYLMNHLKNKLRECPDKKAFIAAEDHHNSVTYKQLYEHVQSVETYLDNIGFKKGDVALIAAPNSWQYIVILAAVACRGGALSGANPDYTSFELKRQILDCKANVVFCGEETLKRVQNATKDLNNIKLIVISNAHAHGVTTISDVLKTKPRRLAQPRINPETDLVLIPYSSGTTGDPKGVMLSHRNMVAMLEAIETYYDQQLMKDLEIDMGKETICLLMPMFHAYGCCVSLNTLIRGTTIVLLKKFDFELFCKTIQDFKVRVQFLVPMIILLLVNHPLVKKYNLSSLEVIQSGAAPLGSDICELAFQRYPNLRVLGQGYGMTECTVGSHFLAVTKNNFSQVGLLAPNMELKIQNPETGEEMPIGKEGEVCIKGPNVMVGYLNKPDATKKTIINGWLHTGDIGYQDESGLLYIVDRLKELIKVNGFQVPPAQLEGILVSHPDIADAAVIGIPDQMAGELPKAFVVRKSDKLSVEDVKAFVAERTVHYKHLKGGVEFVKEIPRSPAGKILRKDLRLLEKKKAKL